MLEFLATYHLTGLAIGLATFLVIGVFHPIVIKAEYYWGVRCWWVFLVAALAAMGAAVWVRPVFWSSLCGVVAFSCLWSIGELFEQRRRVERGWFPANPRRGKK